jgi:hypothetical protein
MQVKQRCCLPCTNPEVWRQLLMLSTAFSLQCGSLHCTSSISLIQLNQPDLIQLNQPDQPDSAQSA